MLVYGKMLGMTGSLFIQGCVNRNTKLKNVAMKGHCTRQKKKKRIEYSRNRRTYFLKKW